MTQPLMIYASAKTIDGNWSATPAPTVVPANTAFPFWPDLDAGGDNIIPTEGEKETPEYLFAAAFTPTLTQTFTFTRSWSVTGASFIETRLPSATYNIVLTHAADNLYTATLLRDGVPLDPVISNQHNVPDANQWRNVKTIDYKNVFLDEGETLQLQTEVTNLGLAGGTPQTNPGMFTWTLGIYA
jgi:hypothetical protein